MLDVQFYSDREQYYIDMHQGGMSNTDAKFDAAFLLENYKNRRI